MLRKYLVWDFIAVVHNVHNVGDDLSRRNQLYFGPLGLPCVAPKVLVCFEPAFPFDDIFTRLVYLSTNLFFIAGSYVGFEIMISHGSAPILQKFLQQPLTKYA
jgi:hypothetical protein